MRVLGIGGYQADALRLVAFNSGSTSQSLAVLAPSRGNTSTDFAGSELAASANWNAFTLTVSGSGIGGTEEYALSFNTSSANYITKVISSDPQSTKSGNSDSSVYVYKVWSRTSHASSFTANSSASVDIETDGLDFISGTNTVDNDGNESTDWTGNKDYQTARTPFLQSQLVNGARYKLFRVYTRSHGTDINKDLKIAIRDIKPAADIAGSDYGTFSLQVRENKKYLTISKIIMKFPSYRS